MENRFKTQQKLAEKQILYVETKTIPYNITVSNQTFAVNAINPSSKVRFGDRKSNFNPFYLIGPTATIAFIAVVAVILCCYARP